jgi:biopolymer transport protein ExbB/TolQ
MNVISNILYWISTGLLVPVIVLLILLFVRALFLIGGFFGQYLTERKNSAFLAEKVEKLSAENLDEFETSLQKMKGSTAVSYMKKMFANRDNKSRVEMLVSEYEVEADKNLALPKTLTKLGPMLGLMGTLIPMGPALVGLSSGDIASMAYNMQVAFATTVVGMVISAIGFITQQTKERWFVKNLTTLEYVADLITKSKEDKQ